MVGADCSGQNIGTVDLSPCPTARFQPVSRQSATVSILLVMFMLSKW